MIEADCITWRSITCVTWHVAELWKGMHRTTVFKTVYLQYNTGLLDIKVYKIYAFQIGLPILYEFVKLVLLFR